nr:PREDICTED: uncharacterized protein LOC102359267 [Latimeria chalumnae]XP_014351933.1 PREDICTED: uncharacterized protein LOC102359267 [Latimeria chalumnae]|eukprot:XP_006009088.1 PREDICTED: uncharacterized protein LOC102359267 [Latimeria chalumnae]
MGGSSGKSAMSTEDPPSEDPEVEHVYYEPHPRVHQDKARPVSNLLLNGLIETELQDSGQQDSTTSPDSAAPESYADGSSRRGSESPRSPVLMFFKHKVFHSQENAGAANQSKEKELPKKPDLDSAPRSARPKALHLKSIEQGEMCQSPKLDNQMVLPALVPPASKALQNLKHGQTLWESQTEDIGNASSGEQAKGSAAKAQNLSSSSPYRRQKEATTVEEWGKGLAKGVQDLSSVQRHSSAEGQMDRGSTDNHSGHIETAASGREPWRHHWRNSMRKEDGHSQEFKELLKEVITEVGSLQQELQELMTKNASVTKGAEFKEPSLRANELQGRTSSSLKLRTTSRHWAQQSLEGYRKAETEKGLLAAIQSWQSKLTDIQGKLNVSLEDVDALKGRQFHRSTDEEPRNGEDFQHSELVFCQRQGKVW